jgi:glycosyltransferase involved in cell wall biosynthesis
LGHSSRAPDELIVVDDASTDESALIARQHGAQVVSLVGTPHGPAAARNAGAAAARGNLLVFIDADVAVNADTLGKIADYFEAHPELAALFGSYDDTPAARNLISLYKNLQHHYVHQHARREASTFWAGCGTVRRDAFLKVGGFDTAYHTPSIEDIELGLRLRQAGERIWLCKDVQAKHLKRWTLKSWLRADIFARAVPWTKLILASGGLPSDLNLDASSRISALATLSLVPLFVLGFWAPVAWLAALASLLLIIILNAGLYGLFLRQGGLPFAIAAVGCHLLYFFYSTVVFGVLSARSFIKRTTQRLAGATAQEPSL